MVFKKAALIKLSERKCRSQQKPNELVDIACQHAYQAAVGHPHLIACYKLLMLPVVCALKEFIEWFQ